MSLPTSTSAKNLAEQCFGDSSCFLTPRLGGDWRKNGRNRKDARVFPSAVSTTQQIDFIEKTILNYKIQLNPVWHRMLYSC